VQIRTLCLQLHWHCQLRLKQSPEFGSLFRQGQIHKWEEQPVQVDWCNQLVYERDSRSEREHMSTATRGEEYYNK